MLKCFEFFCLVDGPKTLWSDPLIVVIVLPFVLYKIKIYMINYCTSKSCYKKTCETMHQPSISHQSCGGLMESLVFVHDTKQWFFAHGRRTVQIRKIKQPNDNVFCFKNDWSRLGFVFSCCKKNIQCHKWEIGKILHMLANWILTSIHVKKYKKKN